MKTGMAIIRTPKKVKKGEAIKVTFVIIHPMHTGRGKDKKTKKKIPAHFLTDIKVTFDGETVATLVSKPAVSKNPTFVIYMLAKKSGSIKLDYSDNKGNNWDKVHQLSV